METTLTRLVTTFVSTNRKCRVKKHVQEVYLRDDCGPLPGLSDDTLYVIDPDVALHQLDLLSDASCGLHFVVTYSVLQKLRAQIGHHNRLRALIRQREGAYVFPDTCLRATHVPQEGNEKEEDRIHRTCRKVVQHYAKEHSKVILLCHEERRKHEAEADGVRAMTCNEYAHSVRETHPNAAEKLFESEEMDEPPAKRARIDKVASEYPVHLTTEEMSVLLKNGSAVQGVLRLHMKSCTHGVVQCGDLSVEIHGRISLNRAIEGDIVCVQISAVEKEESDDEARETITESIKEDQTNLEATKEGKVVGILKRNWREYCGTLKPMEEGIDDCNFTRCERLFIPSDARIPYIRLSTRQSAQLEGKRIVVVIDSWDRLSRNPRGHWIKVLGDVGDRNVESAVILHEHGVITRDFSEQVLQCLPKPDFKPTEDEIAKRWDLRSVVVCSVDPPGCKDIDDALSCELLPNGNFRVGVHIADVTYFVAPDSPIDLEAQERCTTVYLVERRTDMLPGLLTTDLCSLVANVDRLTFSVLWEMTPEGEIVSKKFGRAVICSRAALSYAAAQARIDDKTDESDITQSLRRLNTLAKILRERRAEKGALELASQEVKFELDSETHDPLDVATYTLFDTNRLVEEFMLLANSSVAEHILHHFPSHSVLRRHPPPKDEALSVLQGRLKLQNLPFTYESNKALQASLAACSTDDPYFNQLIRIMTTRCMNQALYFCTGDVDRAQYSHYGLAMDLYTHFTSPIRRYADVLVHRLLACSLGQNSLPDQLSSKDRVKTQCDTINVKHRMAQWAGRSSADLHTFLYFQKKGPQTAEAIVLKVRRKGDLQVTVPRYGIEGLVFMDGWIVDEEKQCVSKEGLQLSVFDHISVEISADNDEFRNKTMLRFIEKMSASGKVNLKKQAKIRREMFPDSIVREAN